MVAIDEGIFKRLGLEAEMVLIGINSNIPAALLSNSIQIGGPTSSVFLQAVDGGLDLVAVGGASAMNERTANLVAVVGRTGVNLKEPKDFVGKKVGAPGLGAFLHVLFVKWLMEKGVDPKGVTFVEVSFPTMNDILKSGAVDAVLAGEPFITRMSNAGTGTAAFRYLQELNRSEPVIFYAASRDWAEKNPEAIKKFRAGIAEGAKIVNSDRDKVSASIYEVHQAAAGHRQDVSAGLFAAGAEGRRSRLVGRRHEAAEADAEQRRSCKAHPEVR